MGLDPLHLVAVPEPLNKDDYFHLETFPPEAFSQYGLSRFIRDVPDFQVTHTVQFLADRRTFDYAIAHRETDGYAPDRVTYFLGTPKSCEADLREPESRLSLNRADAWFTSTTALDRGEKYPARLAIYGRWRADYSGQEIFVDRQHFERLESYLWTDAPDEARINLRDNFVALYEEGKSFLWISG